MHLSGKVKGQDCLALMITCWIYPCKYNIVYSNKLFYIHRIQTFCSHSALVSLLVLAFPAWDPVKVLAGISW